jgi:hypothetical protein
MLIADWLESLSQGCDLERIWNAHQDVQDRLRRNARNAGASTMFDNRPEREE